MPGRARGQSNSPQERPAAGAPAQHAGLSADLPNLPCDPTVPEGFPDPPSLTRRGKMPPHAISATRKSALLPASCSPRMVPVGCLSKLQKEVGQWTAVEVPSPHLLTASSFAERAQHFPLFPEVLWQERALHLEVSLWLSFPCTSEKGNKKIMSAEVSEA